MFCFIQSLPSTTLDTSIEEDVSPTTFNNVAGGSIIVAMIVRIGKAVNGNPIIVRINVSEIVPPPTGTAVTRSVASKATPRTVQTLGWVPNKYTKNIILNTEPITDPSLWKLVPNGIIVSAISFDTPIFLAQSVFTGIDAADEHVLIAVAVAGKIFAQKALNPLAPPAMNAYSE